MIRVSQIMNYLLWLVNRKKGRNRKIKVGSMKLDVIMVVKKKKKKKWNKL